MSKYTELKNKQKLAKALEEIGMTVDEAKQWLADAASQQANQQNTCTYAKHKATGKSCFPEGSLDEQLAFAFWFKEHEDAYSGEEAKNLSELDRIAATHPYSCENTTKEAVQKKCVAGHENKCNTKINKSNVYLVSGASPELYVGGTRVTGDYKLSYTYDTSSKKKVLQVEFIDPV